MELVTLASAEGRKRLEETVRESGSGSGSRSAVQLDVVRSFRKQRGNTVCGLASLAVLLTARNISLARPDQTEENSRRDGDGDTANAPVPEVPVADGIPSRPPPGGAATVQDDDTLKAIIDDRCHFVDEDDVYPMAMSAAAETPAVTVSSHPGTRGVVSETKIRTSGMTLDQARALAQALPTTEKAIVFSPPMKQTVQPLVITEGMLSDGRRATIPGNVDENESRWHDDTANEAAKASTTTSTAPVAAAAASAAASAAARRILSGPDDLRRLVVEVLSKPPSREGLVLNYHMSTLGQVPFGGHLSPVAAYHGATDCLLILDVWHTETEPVWAPLGGGVWKAIAAIDPESGAPRGILKLVQRPRVLEAGD